MKYVVLLLVASSACTRFQPGRAIFIGSASTSHMVCSAVFISGRDPDLAYAEEMRPESGMGLIDWALGYEVNRDDKSVRTRIAGGFASRAVYYEGLGCRLDNDDNRALPMAPPPVELPEDTSLVETNDPRIREAIDAAFAEPNPEKKRNTKAVVVMHHGIIIAERYAPGIDVTTSWHGHSISKAVTNALIGILVRQNKLNVHERAPIAEWHDRPDVTIDQLMRMTRGGLEFEFYSGFSSAARMWAQEADMAGFAARSPQEVPPGSRWSYSDQDYMLLSRIVTERAGSQSAALQLARDELFAPLGMRHAVVEVDGAGTFIGASHIYASARDWARFGSLYMHDGVVGERRVLPEGWVNASATPSLGTGYGAGFWLNTIHTKSPIGIPWGLPGAPPDAFFAFGYLGQYVVIVPSADLVIVRLGVSHDHRGNGAMVGALVAAIVQATSAIDRLGQNGDELACPSPKAKTDPSPNRSHAPCCGGEFDAISRRYSKNAPRHTASMPSP